MYNYQYCAVTFTANTGYLDDPKVQGAYTETSAPLWLTQICNSLCIYGLLSEIKEGAFSCGTSVQNVQRLDRGVTE